MRPPPLRRGELQGARQARAGLEPRPYTKKSITQGGLMWTSAPTLVNQANIPK